MSFHAAVRVAAFALALIAPVAQANDFSTLEERMTGREFRDAGLHKLTEQELENLNRWIQLRSLAEGELPDWAEDASSASSAEPGAEAAAGSAASGDNRGLPGGERTEINSRLLGNFSGWSGDDLFELENGMVWQQAESGTFSVSDIENPQVLIRPGMFGSWQLQVEGYNTRVRVRRVR
ncbi:hypothetical protein [Wenzhouxiangella limi]|uniref:Secreted protein n=1 Tax=Wenzhouxiangella limi TaxID=2707351 RepID=A0A845UYF7_9GAMM|nr:hypothetical protein [Wenzhouxiangella limi]NDY95534.1 hypothetical protein [Wenzhouxiangella limi]